MIDVELQAECRARHLLDDVAGLREVVEEIARHVAGVEWLDQKQYAGRFGAPDGLPEIFDVGYARRGMRKLRWHDTRHDVQLRAAERFRIAESLLDAIGEIRALLRKDRQAALTLVPIAGPQIEERLLQAALIQAPADLGRRIIVGEQELNGLKARVRRRLEAVEEVQLREQHRQIGGEARHDPSVFRTADAVGAHRECA